MGTLVKLLSSTVFDINAEEDSTDQLPIHFEKMKKVTTNQQPAQNHQPPIFAKKEKNCKKSTTDSTTVLLRENEATTASTLGQPPTSKIATTNKKVYTRKIKKQLPNPKTLSNRRWFFLHV